MCTKVLNWTFELANRIHFGALEHFVLVLYTVANVSPQVLLLGLLAVVGSYTFLIKHISLTIHHYHLL